MRNILHGSFGMQKASLTLLALAASLALANTAYAQTIDCNNPQDQASMTQCAWMAYDEADRELNTIWPQIRAYVGKLDSVQPKEQQGAVAALVKSQRAWIEYRDGTCEAEGFQARGGTLEPQIVGSCKARVTRQRTQELRAFNAN